MISVIIPVYNAEKYLTHTIRCLQAQTCTDFEVLLINDGSTDNSARICREAAGTDRRFRLLEQENQGVSAARNYGLKMALGEYITFLDADDEIPVNYLEVLYRTLTDHDCPMSVCDVTVIEQGNEINRFTLTPQRLTQRDALNYLLTRRCINSGPCAKLFQRKVLDGLEFPALRAYEDILFVVDAICRCEWVAVTNQTAYCYIQNTGSAMNLFAKMPSEDIVAASAKLMDFAAARTELSPECFYITASHLMQCVLPLVGNKAPEATKFISDAKQVYAHHKKDILKCAAFPWKEKIMYILFTGGWLYHDKKMRRI